MEYTFEPIDNELTETQKENTIKLIDALRSGNYKQGFQQLKMVNDGEICHCCLGVGTEILGVESSNIGVRRFEYPSGGKYDLPPVDWWISNYGWNFKTKPLSIDLLNDEKVPFNDIADLIESIVLLGQCKTFELPDEIVHVGQNP